MLMQPVAAVVVVAVAAAVAEAARGGGGGGGGAHAAAGGGGGGARAGGGAQASGGARQNAQVNNTKADARTNNVRSTSVNNVNNVNVDRNVNVNASGNNMLQQRLGQRLSPSGHRGRGGRRGCGDFRRRGLDGAHRAAGLRPGELRGRGLPAVRRYLVCPAGVAVRRGKSTVLILVR